MKKLMITAAAVAMTAGAFAAPIAYDYKASVKHMYLKRVNVRGVASPVYQKFQKSASLKGYLIMDNDGVTSPTYNAASPAACFDQGKNRGFLVVYNSKVENDVRAAKILPAVLDAKWLDTKFTQNHEAKSGLAEGTLFAGGDTIAAVRPLIDDASNIIDATHSDAARTTPSTTTPAASTPGFVAYSDYVWTSVYLFGEYNGPNWYKEGLGGPFDAFEAAWDGNLPAGVQRGVAAGDPFFHDTWLNGAGVGKYINGATTPLCCGLESVTDKVLDTLSGNLKGGIFICTDNGVRVQGSYDWFDTPNTTGWEDQFVTARITDGSGTYGTDKWQNDVWQDGSVEQETTDVVFGSWSIKLNRTFGDRIAVGLTAAELASIVPTAGTDELWSYIKGAAIRLNNRTTLWDGTEIYTKTAPNRFRVPMITPQFKAYYGL